MQPDDFDNAWDEDGQVPATDEQADEFVEDEAPEQGDEAETDEQAPPVDQEDQGEDRDQVDDWKAKHDELMHRTKSWEGRLSASDRERLRLQQENEELKKRTEAQPAAPAIDGESDLDDAEKAVFDELPEFAIVLEKREQRLRKQLEQEFNQRLAPISEMNQREVEERHYAAIEKDHPDWIEIAQSDDLTAYIDQQPTYIADSMRRVMASGSAAEAVDLLSRYKAQRKRAEGQQQRNKQALDAAAVTSSRGAPVSRATKDDFDSAFDEAPD